MWKRFQGQQVFVVTLAFYVIGNLSACATSKAQSQEMQLKPQQTIEYSSHMLFHKVDFIEHVNPNQPMQNYLSLNIAFSEVARIRQKLEARLGQTLKNRGEAHITVITPVEFIKSQAMQKVGMKAVHNKALQYEIQNINYKPVCVGRGQKKDEKSGQTQQTFFIVVQSPELFELRKKIKEELQLNDFSLENFYPHITLGFTHRDLHFEEGVVKDQDSCWILLSAQE